MIDFTRLTTLFDLCKGKVKYRLGAKVPLSTEPFEIEEIDCSGWVRYHLANATDHKLPDGSQNQLAWARKNLRKLDKYSDVQYAKEDDGRLFVGFLSPKPGRAWPRHVWLVWKGKTMESCSSLGVGRRAWNCAALIGCKECFEVL